VTGYLESRIRPDMPEYHFFIQADILDGAALLANQMMMVIVFGYQLEPFLALAEFDFLYQPRRAQRSQNSVHRSRVYGFLLGFYEPEDVRHRHGFIQLR